MCKLGIGAPKSQTSQKQISDLWHDLLQPLIQPHGQFQIRFTYTNKHGNSFFLFSSLFILSSSTQGLQLLTRKCLERKERKQERKKKKDGGDFFMRAIFKCHSTNTRLLLVHSTATIYFRRQYGNELWWNARLRGLFHSFIHVVIHSSISLATMRLD